MSDRTPLPPGTLLDGTLKSSRLALVTIDGEAITPFLALTGPNGWAVIPISVHELDEPLPSGMQALAAAIQATKPRWILPLRACPPRGKVWIAARAGGLTGCATQIIRGNVEATMPAGKERRP